MTLDNYHQQSLIVDNDFLPRQNIDFEIVWRQKALVI